MLGSLMNGYPVLLQDVEEHIDPSIETILNKAFYKDSEGRTLIRFADKGVDYHPNFRLYLTTKMPNPHYLPETFIKVNIINFTVTFDGLEDQLLADVVTNEKPEIEHQKDTNIRNLANYKKKLVQSQI